MKVIKAMQDNKVAEMHLSGTTGYGYNDDGRDTLEKIYSDIFKILTTAFSTLRTVSVWEAP